MGEGGFRPGGETERPAKKGDLFLSKGLLFVNESARKKNGRLK